MMRRPNKKIHLTKNSFAILHVIFSSYDAEQAQKNKGELAMRPTGLIILSAAVFFIQGCTTLHYMKINVVETEGQRVIYNDGKETVLSLKKHFVTLTPYRELIVANGKTLFIIFIQNFGSDLITISSANISVTFEGNTEKWISQRINVQSYNELLLEIVAEETSQRRAAAWMAVAGAINAQNAARSTSTTYNSGNAYGSYSANSYGTYANNPYSMNTTGNLNSSFSGYSTTTTYDPAKAQELANQNNQNIINNLNNIAAQSKSRREFLEAFVMKSQTIMPGQSYGGLVYCDTRAMNHKVEGNFKVVISVDGEDHIFNISRHFHSSQ
jgi:hypothetical protein